MPVKQAETSSWRRVVSVGVEVGGAGGRWGVGVVVLAIDIFVGLGWNERRNLGLQTENPGNWHRTGPAAVENGGALGHALMGRISSRHGKGSRVQ